MNQMSIKNQRITDKLVKREVCACISDMAEHLFDWENDKYASYDEWENYYVATCPNCGDIGSILHNETPADNETDEYAEENPYQCSCGARFENEPETEPQEIYEYWIVTSWFGEKLRDHGQPVLERWGGWIWGRTCTGQAISMDGVIWDIAEEMQILEGMQNEWCKGE